MGLIASLLIRTKDQSSDIDSRNEVDSKTRFILITLLIFAFPNVPLSI